MTGAKPWERPSAWHVCFQNIYFDQDRIGGGKEAFNNSYAGKLFQVDYFTNTR